MLWCAGALEGCTHTHSVGAWTLELMCVVCAGVRQYILATGKGAVQEGHDGRPVVRLTHHRPRIVGAHLYCAETGVALNLGWTSCPIASCVCRPVVLCTAVPVTCCLWSSQSTLSLVISVLSLAVNSCWVCACTPLLLSACGTFRCPGACLRPQRPLSLCGMA